MAKIVKVSNNLINIKDDEMVRIHVWTKNETHIGHASLTIGTTYVSFWPEGDAVKKDLKLKEANLVLL